MVVIPVTDIREGGPVRHAIDGRARARALRDDCLAWLPSSLQVLLPAMDAITRHWLVRSASPYVTEIRSIAGALGFPGVWFLNGTYEWGCTAVAREEGGVPWLVRTLDWPFRGLGRHLEVARMRGPAGDFFNVAWPGYAGTLTASAPQRFAAAINQAHLLRDVFENCRDFAEARDRLERTPIARPAIFTLVGVGRGERCVIERTEEGYVTHSDTTAAANDWFCATAPWEARVAAKLLLTCSYEDAAARSRARREALWSWQQAFSGDMAWLVPPVLNWFTRCAVEMCPARGILRVAGYEPEPESDLPLRVTEICEVVEAPFSIRRGEALPRPV